MSDTENNGATAWLETLLYNNGSYEKIKTYMVRNEDLIKIQTHWNHAIKACNYRVLLIGMTESVLLINHYNIWWTEGQSCTLSPAGRLLVCGLNDHMLFFYCLWYPFTFPFSVYLSNNCATDSHANVAADSNRSSRDIFITPTLFSFPFLSLTHARWTAWGEGATMQCSK